ncbi:MAG: trigger factor [Rhodospirillaceae bacterium]|nr:trigger factor [Rhodospirillaceae bacterium]
MDVTETLSDGLKHEFKVVVPAGEIDERIGDRLEEIRKTVRMPGFRPGKVPANLVRKQYEKAILGEVLEDTVNTTSQQALADRGVRPAMQPKIEIEEFAEGQGLSYKMAVEALPEIDPGDLSALKITKLQADVSDDMVTESLGRLAEQQKSYAELEEQRPAETGDALVIDFTGQLDGEVFEGGSGQGFLLELGSGRFIPGFEEQLVGASAGDKRTVEATFPEDYPREDLVGKTATFDVDVKEIRVPKAIEVNDDFAKSLGLDTLDALRDAMRERLQQEYEQASRFRMKRQLLDLLAEQHHFEVPPGMVDQEFETIWHQLEHEMEDRKTTFEDEGKSEEEMRAEYRRIAERRVRLGLLLSEIGRVNNVTVPQEDVNRAIIEQARRYPGQEKEVFEFYKNNPQAMFELRAPLFEDRVVDFILELAQVEEQTVSAEELMRDPEEDQSEGEEAAKKS